MLKRILVTVAMIGVTAVAFGQGTVTFNNGASINTGAGARVFLSPDGAPGGQTTAAGYAPAGVAWKAQLYSATGTVTDQNSLAAAGVPVPFRETPTSLSGFVEARSTALNPFNGNAPVNDQVAVTAVPGGPATVQLRAWDAQYATYEAAVAANGIFEESNLLFLATTGIGGPGGTPGAFLNGLQSFTLVVPEPSTYALGALGLVAFLFRRRK